MTLGGCVLWIDVATFTKSGKKSLHNIHQWAIGISHATPCPFQQRFSTYVWAGIVDDYITGLPMISNRLFLRYWRMYSLIFVRAFPFSMIGPFHPQPLQERRALLAAYFMLIHPGLLPCIPFDPEDFLRFILSVTGRRIAQELNFNA